LAKFVKGEAKPVVMMTDHVEWTMHLPNYDEDAIPIENLIDFEKLMSNENEDEPLLNDLNSQVLRENITFHFFGSTGESTVIGLEQNYSSLSGMFVADRPCVFIVHGWLTSYNPGDWMDVRNLYFDLGISVFSSKQTTDLNSDLKLSCSLKNRLLTCSSLIGDSTPIE
jgi:hypothetical protein